LPATAPGTDKPLAPIENRRVRAVPSNHLGGVRLDLMAARLAPHDQPYLPFAALSSAIGGPGGDFNELRDLMPLDCRSISLRVPSATRLFQKLSGQVIDCRCLPEP
jgi:hypothetical protein